MSAPAVGSRWESVHWRSRGRTGWIYEITAVEDDGLPGGRSIPMVRVMRVQPVPYSVARRYWLPWFREHYVPEGTPPGGIPLP